MGSEAISFCVLTLQLIRALMITWSLFRSYQCDEVSSCKFYSLMSSSDGYNDVNVPAGFIPVEGFLNGIKDGFGLL